jgi:hypothetical protein
MPAFPGADIFSEKNPDMGSIPDLSEVVGFREIPQSSESGNTDTEISAGGTGTLAGLQSVMLFGVSVLVLLTGIVIAKKFRK